ncbi:MAG: ATP-binding protein [DPANN group archaeon]|nr:ATP-binding protein [DPANN group archaeon]
MNSIEILEILNDWNFWKKKQFVGVRRSDVFDKIKKLIELDEIIVISGARRTGKSTVLMQICEDLIVNGVDSCDILIINFEDPRFKSINLELLNKIYDVYLTDVSVGSGKQYVVLDEVQIVSGWEKFARFLHENKKVKVFVIGSSSKLLSSEYSTVLSGRYVDIVMYPLFFKEFVEFNGVDIKNNLDLVSKRHAVKKLFLQYMESGGFPKTVLIDDADNRKVLLNSYFQSILMKDIVMRYNINDVFKLEELTKYYLSNISSLHSFNKIKNIIGGSIDTVERYSSYLRNAYMLFFVRKFSYTLKDQILNPRKVYCIDMGLRNSVSFYFSKDYGKIIENIVYLKLLENKGFDIYYWKDSKQREVDFLVKEKDRICQAIQVCWDVSNPVTKKIEVDALLSALSTFGLKEGLVLTEDYDEVVVIDEKRITFMSVWKWLFL